MGTVNRVRNTALRIAKTLDLKPDPVVVELAALFHDMAGQFLVVIQLDS